MIKNEKGITLIALIVTIVVLLILAGISVKMIVGDNGLVKQAQETRNETEQMANNSQEKMNSVLSEIYSKP